MLKKNSIKKMTIAEALRIAIADEMRARKKDGEFATYREAYKWAEMNISKKGVNITAKKLEDAFYKASSEGRV